MGGKIGLVVVFKIGLYIDWNVYHSINLSRG